jgi:hypothetical protein
MLSVSIVASLISQTLDDSVETRDWASEVVPSLRCMSDTYRNSNLQLPLGGLAIPYCPRQCERQTMHRPYTV